MSNLLDEYMGAEVEVLYTSDYNHRDRGRLVRFDALWIELERGGPYGDLLLIPTTAIRLVKVVTPAKRDARRLLRPAHHKGAIAVEQVEVLEEDR